MRIWGGVTSYAEVWIEIIYKCKEPFKKWVTSYAEVWIEIPEAKT